MTRTTFYTCRGCDHEFEIEVEATPPIPAKLDGLPENCYPAEGGEFCVLSPTWCPLCQTPVDEDKAVEEFWAKLDSEGDDD